MLILCSCMSAHIVGRYFLFGAFTVAPSLGDKDGRHYM